MELLRLSDLPAATGRGVRVAVIDSGVHAAHPHVQGVSGGLGIDAEGREHADYIDRLGHGTAVTAVIRENTSSTSRRYSACVRHVGMNIITSPQKRNWPSGSTAASRGPYTH